MRQLIPWGIDDAPSSTIQQYQSLGGNGAVGNWTSDINEIHVAIPTSGKLTSFSAKGTNGVGTNKKMDIIVCKNSTESNLLLSFTGNEVIKNSSEELQVADGDIVCLKSKPTNNPSPSKFFGAFEFIPDNENETIMLGGTGDNYIGTSSKYLCPAALANGSTVISDVHNVITNVHGGKYGTIKKLRIVLSDAPGGSAVRNFTLYKNGLVTNITLSISGNSKTSSISADVDVSDGDTIALYTTTSGNPSNGRACWGLVIEPVVQGEYLILGASGFSLPTGGTVYEYNRVCSGGTIWNQNKNDKYMGGKQGHKIICLGMKLSQSPSTVEDNKAYELYLENPSVSGQRAYVEGLNTYNKTIEMDWETLEYGNWNVRTLGFFSPRVVTASWAIQMKNV